MEKYNNEDNRKAIKDSEEYKKLKPQDKVPIEPIKKDM